MAITRLGAGVDSTGRLARVWTKVKVEGHAAEVLDAVRAL